MFIFLGREGSRRTLWSPRTERTGKSTLYILFAIVCLFLFVVIWPGKRIHLLGCDDDDDDYEDDNGNEDDDTNLC